MRQLIAFAQCVIRTKGIQVSKDAFAPPGCLPSAPPPFPAPFPRSQSQSTPLPAQVVPVPASRSPSPPPVVPAPTRSAYCAPGCQIAQPDWNTEFARGNVVLRAATPLFGAGLWEAITDAAILASKSANGGAKLALGIFGRENCDATGNVGRFRWKAQLAKLLDFSLEAYAVEMGVTNYTFLAENDLNRLQLTLGS